MSSVHPITQADFVHSTAVIDPPVAIGAGTKVWHFCHLCEGAQVGEGCTLGQNVYIGPAVRVGNGVKIQNNVSIFEGVTVEDDVFIGPSVVFTNVKTPRAQINRREEFVPTLVQRGASIGANATIVCGITIGQYALVGAGAVVTRDVPPFSKVVGHPARVIGWVDERGEPSPPPDLDAAETTEIDAPVTLLDPAAENVPFQAELDAAALAALRSGHFILGEGVRRFEERCAQFLGSAHAVGVSNGTDALLLALCAAGVGPGDEVVTSPFSFISGVEAILRLGATPKFVDIDPATHLLDPKRIPSALTSKTKAVLAVHLFGKALDLSEVRELLSSRGIAVIEDGAQALGARSTEGTVGSAGLCTCFSFFPSKNLGGFGDGGLITTDDGDVVDRLRRLRVHGSREKYLHTELGGNFRLDALQAALLSVKLNYLPDLLARRRSHARRYHARLTSLDLSHTSLTLPDVLDPGHTFNQFVIESDRRDELATHLREKGIDTAIYYPVPLHRQPVLGDGRGQLADYPMTERACSRVLALPVHPALSCAQIDRVCDEVARFFRRNSLE